MSFQLIRLFKLELVHSIKFSSHQEVVNCIKSTCTNMHNVLAVFCDSCSLLDFVTRTRLPPDRDRRHGNAPFFGIQMAPDCEGFIKIGDPVLISG